MPAGRVARQLRMRPAPLGRKSRIEAVSQRVRDDARHRGVRLLGSPLEQVVYRLWQAKLGLDGLLTSRTTSSLPHNFHHRPVDVIQQLPVSRGQRDLQLNPDLAI